LSFLALTLLWLATGFYPDNPPKSTLMKINFMTILYLRWLKKHVMQLGENPPIGAALCFEKYYKRVKLLQLEKVVFEFANL
jgi:hypothetical protein